MTKKIIIKLPFEENSKSFKSLYDSELVFSNKKCKDNYWDEWHIFNNDDESDINTKLEKIISYCLSQLFILFNQIEIKRIWDFLFEQAKGTNNKMISQLENNHEILKFFRNIKFINIIAESGKYTKLFYNLKNILKQIHSNNKKINLDDFEKIEYFIENQNQKNIFQFSINMSEKRSVPERLFCLLEKKYSDNCCEIIITPLLIDLNHCVKPSDDQTMNNCEKSKNGIEWSINITKESLNQKVKVKIDNKTKYINLHKIMDLPSKNNFQILSYPKPIYKKK